jgi:FkbM family methyltransferase
VINLRNYLYKKKLRILRKIEIIKTPYWKLFFHDDLNYVKKEFPVWYPKLIKQDGEWQIFEIENFQFYWPKNFSEVGLKGIYREVFAPAVENPHAYEFGKTKIVAGNWVIDAGASEGFFVHYALKKNANVLAVEPIPKLAEALRNTFRQEIRQGRVFVLNAALGNQFGFTNINFDQEQSYNASINHQLGSKVEQYTIDKIFKDRVIPQIDFIKMDIENSEIEAIEGAMEVITNLKPKLSIAVYHEFYNAQIIRDLLLKQQSRYKINYRGILFKNGFIPPRPYIIHAY